MTLYWIILIVILIAAFAVVACEMYKVYFESSNEAKDERGMLILLKQKSLSYHILFLGICASFFIFLWFKWLDLDLVIYWLMAITFLQSIASTLYTMYLRKAE